MAERHPYLSMLVNSSNTGILSDLADFMTVVKQLVGELDGLEQELRGKGGMIPVETYEEFLRTNCDNMVGYALNLHIYGNEGINALIISEEQLKREIDEREVKTENIESL